jgi:hypothetical protein
MHDYDSKPALLEEHRKEQLAVLQEWFNRIRVNIQVHNESERRFKGYDTILSILMLIPLVTLGVVAASFDLSSSVGKYLILSLTLVGTVTSLLQWQLDFKGQAYSHWVAGRLQQSLRRSIEIAATELDDRVMEVRIEEIRRQWDIGAYSAQNVPRDILKRARKERSISPLFPVNGMNADKHNE